MENFDLKKDFIEYWDHVIRLWLEQNADVTLFKNDEDAKEQLQVIKAINDNCKNSANYKLNTMHMPEPYWGNPTDCSIVLLDYNPAGGPDTNRHTTIKYKDGDESGMKLIKYVNEYGYSNFATKCPVFRDAKDLKEKKMGWFCAKKIKGGKGGYEGYHWWQSKHKWLDHLVVAACGKKDERLPFGMELCGWHSRKWSSNMSWIDGCRKTINERAIQPLFESLKKSPAKMAVCIGAKFDPKLLSQFFNMEIDKFDVTEEIYGKINKDIIIGDYSKYQDLSYTINRGKDNIHVIARWKNKGKDEEPKNRNYRIYKITEGKESYYILNTYAPGSNHHPGEHFWPFEKVLIDAIKKA